MWNGVNAPMTVTKVTSTEDSDAAPSGEAAEHSSTAAAQQADVGTVEVSDDGKDFDRLGVAHRSCAPETVAVENRPPSGPSEDNTHSLLASTDGREVLAPRPEHWWPADSWCGELAGCRAVPRRHRRPSGEATAAASRRDGHK